MKILNACGRRDASARTRFAFCSVGVLASLACLPVASAQSLPNSPSQAAEEGLRRQEDRLRELQQQLQPKSDVLSPATTVEVSTDLPEETPCFPLRDIRIVSRDGTRFFSWLDKTVEPYLGQCAGVAGVSQIAAAVDAKLIELGYATTKVTLPEQNLQSGQLILQLHVGRIAEIRMVQNEGRTPDRNWGTWRNAFPMSKGGVLNIRDLEQGVEQMKRLPSQAVATELEPGSEPDTSNVVIVRQSGSLAERLRGGITIDNSGSRSLGTTQLSGYLSADNPLGLNDLLSLSINSNVEHLKSEHRSQSGSLNYSIPWGYHTFTFSNSHNRFAQMVQGTTTRFLSSGSSRSSSLRWDYMAMRTSAAKAGIYAAISTRRARSYLDDVELIMQRRRTTSYETGVTYKQLVGAGSIDFELGHRRGMSWRDAQDDLPNAGQGNPTLRPEIWLLSGSYLQPFTLAGRPFQYALTVRGQHTKDMTLSVDQIAIGNRFSVRGFDGENVLLAESGYYLRNEFSTPVALAEPLNTMAYVGIDFGRVWGASDINLVGDKLAGIAAGLRGQWKSLQFDAALATPLHKPSGFQTRNWNAYLSVTYAF